MYILLDFNKWWHHLILLEDGDVYYEEGGNTRSSQNSKIIFSWTKTLQEERFKPCVLFGLEVCGGCNEPGLMKTLSILMFWIFFIATLHMILFSLEWSSYYEHAVQLLLSVCRFDIHYWSTEDHVPLKCKCPNEKCNQKDVIVIMTLLLTIGYL